jgi:low temperature requirement protein LtrA
MSDVTKTSELDALRAAVAASGSQAANPPPIVEPPRLRPAEADPTRRSTWLEQFYDLIYSLVIAECAEQFSAHRGLDGFGRFLGVFLPVWITWVGHTMYSTRYDTDDIPHRLLTFVQMLAAITLAVMARGEWRRSARSASPPRSSSLG